MIKETETKVNRRGDNTVEVEKNVLTVEELAKELRISKNLAYRQVREGRIYSIRCGDRYLIPRRPLEELLSGQQRGEREGGGGTPAPSLALICQGLQSKRSAACLDIPH
jgi:excisionase family DNA binding protein